MNDKQIEEAYNRLAFLHTETMAELVETRKQMEHMSGTWFRLLCYWVKVKLGIVSRWD